MTLSLSPAVTQTAGMQWLLLLFGVVVAIIASIATVLAKQQR